MREITGDLFESVKADAICITTNGFVNSHGANTMGRGCAAQASLRWPGVEFMLGSLLMSDGNHVHVLTVDRDDQKLPACLLTEPWGGVSRFLPYHLVSFPVKPDRFVVQENQSNVVAHLRDVESFGRDCRAPGWGSVADVGLIIRSAKELVTTADHHKWESIVVPRPGCGAGELNWAKVGPILSAILDDRFYAITFK